MTNKFPKLNEQDKRAVLEWLDKEINVYKEERKRLLARYKEGAYYEESIKGLELVKIYITKFMEG